MIQSSIQGLREQLAARGLPETPQACAQVDITDHTLMEWLKVVRDWYAEVYYEITSEAMSRRPYWPECGILVFDGREIAQEQAHRAKAVID